MLCDDGGPCAHQQPRQPWSGDEPIDQRAYHQEHRRQYLQHVLRDRALPAVRNTPAAGDPAGINRGRPDGGACALTAIGESKMSGQASSESLWHFLDEDSSHE